MERLEWHEAVRIRSFHSSLFVSDVNSRILGNQPEQTLAQLTFFLCGTVQLDPRAGVPSRRQRVLTSVASAPGTENSFTRKHNARQASQKTVLVIQVAPFGANLEAVILPLRLDEEYCFTNIGATIYPENISPRPRSQSGILPREPPGRPRRYRVNSTAGESYGVHICSTPRVL